MSATLITTSEAASRLGLTVRAVQKMIEAGRLEAQKMGRDYFIEAGALENISRIVPGRPPKNALAAPKRTTKRSAKQRKEKQT
jgi:excisionase family DNA binding protein